MCTQDTNIPLQGQKKEESKLDRNLFAYDITYEYCLKKGMTNEQWLKIKNMPLAHPSRCAFLSIKKRTANIT